jgi:hypothetical protein
MVSNWRGRSCSMENPLGTLDTELSTGSTTHRTSSTSPMLGQALPCGWLDHVPFALEQCP